MQNTGIKKISTIFLALAILVLFAAWFPQTQSRIFLIGDSTMANKPLVDNPEHGWGQMLPLFFTQNVQIFNHAVNGRSTKSFIEIGRANV
jgi:DNA sulfur modification protein DndE